MLQIPPFHSLEIVKDAETEEERRKLMEEWLRLFRACNPRYFNADGSQKTWWQVLLWW